MAAPRPPGAPSPSPRARTLLGGGPAPAAPVPQEGGVACSGTPGTSRSQHSAGRSGLTARGRHQGSLRSALSQIHTGAPRGRGQSGVWRAAMNRFPARRLPIL